MPLNLTLLKSCDIRGVFWGAWARQNPEKNRKKLEKLVQWTAEGKISSHVDRTFPLSAAAAGPLADDGGRSARARPAASSNCSRCPVYWSDQSICGLRETCHKLCELPTENTTGPLRLAA